jgi:hypothetical protein
MVLPLHCQPAGQSTPVTAVLITLLGPQRGWRLSSGTETDSTRQRPPGEGTRGIREDRGMVEAGATPSSETDGKPRKTPRLKEEIGQGGGAVRVRPPGTQALEARETGGPPSARW